MDESEYEYEYCFTSLSAQSWQYCDRRKPEAGTMPYSYFEWLQGFFIVHSTIGSTVHSMSLNSLKHCICATTMTNIRPYWDSNQVLQGYKPQSIRISHRGWPFQWMKIYASTQQTKNICITTSAQRLRRSSNIVQMLYKCFVFTVNTLSAAHDYIVFFNQLSVI